MIKILCLSVLTLFIFTFTLSSQSDEPQLLSIIHSGEIETHAFFVEELVEMKDQLPIIRASFGKVHIKNGKFANKVFLPTKERFQYKHILAKYSTFQLYIDKDNIGLFTYKPIPQLKNKKKGFYFSALPIDKDAGLSKIIDKAKEDASLENLLEMDFEEALKSTEKEKILNNALDSLTKIELDTLQNLDKRNKKDFQPFLVITKEKNP